MIANILRFALVIFAMVNLFTMVKSAIANSFPRKMFTLVKSVFTKANSGFA